MFKMFQQFQSYVAISVFMLQVTSVFIWTLHMFHTHVASVCSNVLFDLDFCCIQMFHVVSVSCFRGMFRESWATAQALGEGARRAGSRRMGRASCLGSYGRSMLVLIPAPGSRPCGERGGGQGKEQRVRDGTGYVCGAGQGGRGQTRTCSSDTT